MLGEQRKKEGPFPIEGGTFIAVVGPSGAGKDTLIGYARARLGADPCAMFVRRVITRASDRAREDHDSLSAEEFARQERKGAFALSWAAHGFRYGIPAAADEAIRSGKVVIANLSRGAIPSLHDRYANVKVVLVTAAPETLARRLAGRRGESEEETRRRIARSADAALAVEGAFTIETDGPPKEAGERLLAFIRQAIAETAGKR